MCYGALGPHPLYTYSGAMEQANQCSKTRGLAVKMAQNTALLSMCFA